MFPYYQLLHFQNFPQFIHGFSTKSQGPFTTQDFVSRNLRLQNFLSYFQIKINDCVMMQQIHGTHIALVGQREKGRVIPQTDGLITQEANVFLLVETADCLPVFFFDEKTKVIGVAHLGWKGCLHRLGSKMVQNMIKLGSSPKNIWVGVGPSIANCCYHVPEARIKQFEKEFGKSNKLVRRKEGNYFLSLQQALKIQLQEEKINLQKLIFSDICNCCDERFFSFRRNFEKKQSNKGNFVGVFGIKKE